MQTDNKAIWACDHACQSILWGNAAAAVLWQCDSAERLQEIPAELLVALRDQQKLSEGIAFTSPSGLAVVLNCELLADGSQLFTQQDNHTELQREQKIAQLVAQNQLVSLYNPLGELICSSDSTADVLLPSDLTFSERFADRNYAEGLWQKLNQADSHEDQCLMKTRQGYHWHFIMLRKVYLSTYEWLIQLTEFDLDPFVQREKGLQVSMKEQEVIFENAGTGICFIQGDDDLNRTIIRCNQKFSEIYDYAPDELIGRSSRILYESNQAFRQLGDVAYPRLRKGGLYRQRTQMRRKDGSLIWTQLRGKMVNPDNPELGYVWVVEDINNYIQANEALEGLLREQNLILDHAMVGIVFLKNRRVTRCNRRFEEIFGYQKGELNGLSSRLWYLTDKDWQAAGEACYEPLSKGEVFEDEMLLAGKDGKPIWCEVCSKAIDPDDLSKGSIWITMDISKRKAADEALAKANEELEQRVEERTSELASTVKELHQEISERLVAEERVKHMALHDALTSLPNRILLEERMEQAISQAKQFDQRLAVMFIDLDRFKVVNDSMGHQEGDQLLIEVAERLHNAVREGDTVARLGGDEFVVLLTNVSAREEVQQVVERIQQAFHEEVRLALHGVYVTPSIGIALFPEDGESSVELMKNADAAMYAAKDQGRNCARYYDRSIEQHLQGQVSLGNALYQALRDEQFELYYQPQVDVVSGQVIGVEALLRWNHPERGLISPAEFIPIAEESGLIVPIGQWVLEQACQQIVAWTGKGQDDFIVSVNLSALQVQQPDFIEVVSLLLDKYQVDPHRIDLELTESVLMRNTEETIEVLGCLHQLGVHISVDDFGTGYSSLSYLKRLPLDKLKIDRSFVSDITTDADDALICRTIISMAKNLNLKVIAEGVETAEQLALLRQYDCEQYQGYYFSKPQPVETLESVIF